MLAAACDAGSRTIAPIRYDSAGVAVVRHASLIAYGRETYRPEYLLTVGEADHPPEHVFGEIGDAALLSDGTLAVLDLQAAEVRLFSAQGEHVATLGRRGQGPGELSGDGTLAVLPLPSRRLAIADLLNQSVSVYGGDSIRGLLETHRMGEGTLDLPEWRSFSGDTVLVRARGDGHESVLARTLDGSWSDTLVSVDPIEQRRSASDPRTPLLPDHWLWSGSPVLGVALARMTAPQIHVYRDSREQLRLAWDAAQSSLSDAEVDHLVGVVGRRLGSGMRDVAAIRNQVLELMAVPDVVPVLADIEFGPHGLLLVQRLRPIPEMDQRILAVFRARGYGGPEWDVFSGTGDYLGVLSFGGNVEIFRVQGDTIVGAREGSEGVQEVFLARFPRALLDAAAAVEAGDGRGSPAGGE